MTNADLERKAIQLRKRLLKVIVDAGAGHTGGGLSSLDILSVLYNRVLNVPPETFSDPHRDRYVQSKGHCVEALYTVLSDRGFFPAADLETVCHYQSHYVGHPTRHIPGIEMSHVGEPCSFDAFLNQHGLDDPALRRLATIVRGADRSRLDLAAGPPRAFYRP